MDLWIRSQDREDLVKANALYVMNNQIWNEVPFYENHKKIGLTITGHNHKLAEYSTKERALEVLDEIQKLLEPKIIVKANTGVAKSLYENVFQEIEIYSQESLNSSRIYQMPEE